MVPVQGLESRGAAACGGDVEGKPWDLWEFNGYGKTIRKAENAIGKSLENAIGKWWFHGGELNLRWENHGKTLGKRSFYCELMGFLMELPFGKH